MSTTLLDVFFSNVRRSPGQDFLVEDKSSSLSYAESCIISAKLLPNWLQRLHPAFATLHQAKVVLVSENNVLVPLLTLALWTMSAKIIPLSSTAEPSLWAGMVDLVEPDVILFSPNLGKALEDSLKEFSIHNKYPAIFPLTSLIPADCLCSNPDRVSHRISDYIPSFKRWITQARPEFDASMPQALKEVSLPSILPDTPAVALFTSSAVDWTSLKCVTYTHEVLAHSGRRAMLMLGGPSYSLTPKRHFGWLPLSHCFELCISFCGVVLQTGGSYLFFDRLVSSPQTSPGASIGTHLLAGLKYYGDVAATTMTPAIYCDLVEQCQQEDIMLLQNLESLGVGGAPITEDIFQWSAANNISVFDCSGATEVAGTIAIRRAKNLHQKTTGLQVIPEFMGFLEKENLDHDYGELVIRSTHLPASYDFRESKSFSFDPLTGVTTYRTGDLYSQPLASAARGLLAGDMLPAYDPDHPALSGLKYIGRLDDMVVLNSGVKIDAISFERTLDSLSKVKRSAVLGSSRGDSLIALVELKGSGHSFQEVASITDSILEVNASMPFEKRLRRECIFIVSSLPVTTKHTLNRKKLKKLLNEVKSDQALAQMFSPLDSKPHDGHDGDSTSSSTRRTLLASILAQVYSLPEQYFMDHGSAFKDIPLTSLSAIQLSKALKDHFSIELTPAQLYSVHSMEDLWHFIASSPRSTNTAPSPSARDARPYEPDTTQLASDIVISGAACRFVGGIDSLDSYWSALLGPDIFLKGLKREAPSSRWPKSSTGSLSDAFFPMGWLEDPVVENIESFSKFFSLSPSEARTLSPNARLAMQLGYTAIEDACIAPHSLRGQNWGIFTSVNDSGWRENRLERLGLHEYAVGWHGSADDAVGARLSYYLDLIGPTVEIKTACSSSAVAIHQACLAIKNGDCDAALVISSCTHFHPAGAIFRSHHGIVSRSGVCAPFSSRADGFVASEGAAAIVLQRASDAQILPYGCILASAITQDGTSRGFFSPNPAAQARLLRAALTKGSLTATELSYMEAHGTGTPIGDSIELQTINEVLCRDRASSLYVGSSKAVIGHTEECSGIAGLLKVLLCLKNNAIPPQPSLGPLTEALGSITVPRTITPFFSNGFRRICSVSSFGLSGTLANIIVGEYQGELRLNTDHAHSDTLGSHIFLFTACIQEDLIASIRKHVQFIEEHTLTTAELESAARTTQIGRDHHGIRFAASVSNWKDLLRELRQFLSQPPLFPTLHPYKRPKIGLWFGMPDSGDAKAVSRHPLLSSFSSKMKNMGWHPSYQGLQDEIALAQCLAALGCDISVVGGAGIGEYAAAVFAGTIPPEAIFRVQGGKSNPAMHVLHCDEAKLQERLTTRRSDEVRILGRHERDRFAVIGDRDCLTDIISDLKIVRHFAQPPLTVLLPSAVLSPPSVPIISAHIGGALESEATTSRTYWNGVQSRDYVVPVALKAMEEYCDLIIDLTSYDDVPGAPFDDKIIAADRMQFERLISLLFQRGCTIDWRLLTSPGPLLRLPGYCWSSST